MNFKKSYYQISQEISPKMYLCTSFISGCYIVLSEDVYSLYNSGELLTLKDTFPKVFQRLCEGNFIIEEDLDEYRQIQECRKKDIEDTSVYHIVVNPTLDCNLSCWYCYENRIPKSMMDEATIEAINKHIALHHEKSPYTTLKLSFFGGEPFLGFSTIRKIVSFSRSFCDKNNIELLLDFTTNGTLCTKEALEFLSDYKCLFQITLDGDKAQHNKVKRARSGSLDAFSTTIECIRNIQEYIGKSFTSVRINYDKETLKNFDSILKELLPLDRKRMKVILKKIWQVDPKEISYNQLTEVMKLLFENKFIVDYYSQGGICFADRKNQAVFNYDGYIFKCTTISKFDEKNSLGTLDRMTGSILWDSQKMSYLIEDKSPDECKECQMYPSCGGPCQKKISEDPNWSCFLKSTNFDLSEFALTQFRTHLIRKQIYEDER